MTLGDAGREELDFRLRQKEREFQQAVIAASGVRVEALADDGVVVPGQSVRVTVLIANNGTRRRHRQAGEVRRLRRRRARARLTPAIAGGGPGGGGGGGARGAAAAPAATPISVLKPDRWRAAIRR